MGIASEGWFAVSYGVGRAARVEACPGLLEPTGEGPEGVLG
ncbi:MAG: hypothetical protein R2731_06995 [Nocardioides sp.]